MNGKEKIAKHMMLILSALAVVMAAINLFFIKQYNQAVSLGISIALILYSILLIVVQRIQDNSAKEEPETDSSWIPCTEKLPIMNGPNDRTLYIATRRGHVGCYALHYDSNSRQWYDDYNITYDDVVAWRFMPIVYDLRARIYESTKIAKNSEATK